MDSITSPLTISVAQVKMARAALDLGVRDLAKLARVSANTIARLERGEELRPATMDAVRVALEAAGVEFIPANGGGAGVRQRTATPRLIRRKISRFERQATFAMSYRSREYRVNLSLNILDDIDRTNYESDTDYENAFDAHVNTILLAAAAAIDVGRASPEGAFTLEWDDFKK